MTLVRIASLCLASAFAAAPALADLRHATGPATILEGDLVEIGGERFRLWGVDAPEPEQICYRRSGEWACGAAAIAHLQAFVLTADVTCSVQEEGPPDALAKCRMKGLDLSAELANHGLALVPPSGPQDYILNHHDGRTHQAGMWGTVYVTPWEWREGRRVLEWIMDARGCAVKGDISEAGERVYYLPYQSAYGDIRIEVARGERWFCSADEAEAEGWEPHR